MSQMSHPVYLLVPALFCSIGAISAEDKIILPPAGEMSSLRGKHRAVTVQCSMEDERLAEFVREWSATHILLAAEERHLLLLWMPPQYEGQFHVSLIGKDGHLKSHWEAPVIPEEVFSMIDAMPMRQSEMRASNKNR